jgi:uncharacterized protein YcbX
VTPISARDTDPVTATVRAIRVYPIKGEPAVDLESVGVGSEGLDGDRRKGASVHLVSLQAIGAAEPPRANLILDLAAGSERDWIGSEILVGLVRLRVVRAPTNCLGVYAEVVRPGRINLGDSVEPRG